MSLTRLTVSMRMQVMSSSQSLRKEKFDYINMTKDYKKDYLTRIKTNEDLMQRRREYAKRYYYEKRRPFMELLKKQKAKKDSSNVVVIRVGCFKVSFD